MMISCSSSNCYFHSLLLHFRAQLLPSLVICNRCKRASCIERDILDHVRGCSGGSCIVVDLKQEKSNIFSQYNDELEVGTLCIFLILLCNELPQLFLFHGTVKCFVFQ